MPSLEGFPNEILLEVTENACVSQESYRSCLLVNKRLHDLVMYDRLPHLPIRVNARTVRAFHKFVTTLEMGKYIRFLWINAGPTQAAHIGMSIHACTNLVALACSKIGLVEMCAHPDEDAEFMHTSLKELTLFGSWACWETIQIPVCAAYGAALCRQITHLRVHDAITEDFNPDWLPALTHCSCVLPLNEKAAEQIARVKPLPSLERIVLSTFHWREEAGPNEKTLQILGMDERVRLLFLSAEDEFALWCRRARGMPCIWTTEMDMKSIISPPNLPPSSIENLFQL